MAYRAMTRATKCSPLLCREKLYILNNGTSVRHHGYSIFKPPVRYLENPSVVFSKKAIMHNWGAVPIIMITVIAFTTEVLYIIRNAVTRMDVQYTRAPAACDLMETRKGYTPERHKLYSEKQKWDLPPGVIEANQTSEEIPETGKKDKSELPETWMLGRVIGLTIVGGTAAVVAALAII